MLAKRTLTTTICRQFRPSTAFAMPIVVTSARRSAFHSISSQQKEDTIIDKAKHKLNDLNKKIGQAAAHGIENAQEASHTIKEKVNVAEDATKETLDAANKKAGKAAAKGIENAQDASHSVKDKLKSAADQSSTGNVKDRWDSATDTASEGVKESLDSAKKKVKKAADSSEKAQEFKQQFKKD